MSERIPPIDAFDGGRLLPLVEDFYTIQGEGANAGTAAYFIRLGGCDAGCPWCDAKYTWNAARFEPQPLEALLARVAATPARAAVITGGEPLHYPLEPLTSALHAQGVSCFLETAGTYPFSGEFDWVCLSPKPQRPPLAVAFGRADELKTIVASEEDLRWAETCAARVGAECRLYLQPEWSVADRITPRIVEFVKEHPQWRISIQTHKYLQIP